MRKAPYLNIILFEKCVKNIIMKIPNPSLININF